MRERKVIFSCFPCIVNTHPTSVFNHLAPSDAILKPEPLGERSPNRPSGQRNDDVGLHRPMRCNPYMSQLDTGADFNAFVHGLEREARAEGPKRRPKWKSTGTTAS
jgi:hypothetical protein